MHCTVLLTMHIFRLMLQISSHCPGMYEVISCEAIIIIIIIIMLIIIITTCLFSCCTILWSFGNRK